MTACASRRQDGCRKMAFASLQQEG